MNIPLPSQKYLAERLIYHPSSGEFFWKEIAVCNGNDAAWNAKYAGKIAGLVCQRYGYRRMCIDGTHYRANRIAWRISTGYDPGELCIDHIDGDKANDAIANLRLVTHSENMRNRGSQSNNASGMKGIYWHRRDKKWIARVCVNRKYQNLGRFKTAGEAFAAYKNGVKKIHGEYANHGEKNNVND
ncbi:HNH endonuclease [Serratia inhibens]|uniref:HNH endonuclease n=1 Tax=Serratia inhibens TaxID=2338073 RepID=UPI0032165BF0